MIALSEVEVIDEKWGNQDVEQQVKSSANIPAEILIWAEFMKQLENKKCKNVKCWYSNFLNKKNNY